jgi:DNA replication protein DnaC
MQSATSTGSSCPRCGGSGNLGWQSPIAGYKLHQLHLCDCAAGEAFRRDAMAYYAREDWTRNQKLFGRSGVPERFAGFTLDSWLAAVDGDKGKDAAAAAAAGWSGVKREWPNSLYLYGEPGTGKSGLATALMNGAAADGVYGLWIEWFDFVDAIQSAYGQNDGTASKQIEAAQTVPLLLLDDVGDVFRGAESPDKQRIVYQVVNARHNNGLPTLFTSNLTPLLFAAQFGERTWRRVAEMSAVVHVAGRNLSLKGKR